MKTKNVCTMVAVVTLAISAGLWADLPAPRNLDTKVVTIKDVDCVTFDWDDVGGAAKYSLDISGTVYYQVPDGRGGSREAEAEVRLSFGTGDRRDGGSMSDSDLTISVADLWAALKAALAAQLTDVGPDKVTLLWADDCSAAVKALAPGKRAGAQNNPFSKACTVDVAGF